MLSAAHRCLARLLTALTAVLTAALPMALPAVPVAAQGEPRVTLVQLPSTVRQGEIVVAQLRIETGDRVFTPELPQVPGLRINLGAPLRSPHESFINGVHSVRMSVVFPLEIRAPEVGKFTIPPIRVRVGDTVVATRERVLDVVKHVAAGHFGSLTVVPSKTRVYVHEPIRFDVECAIDSELDLGTGRADTGERFFAVQVEAEWLSEMDGGELIDEPDTDTDRRYNILLNRTLQPADVTVAKGANGESRTVFRYHKAVLPTRVGKIRLTAPLMRFTVMRGVERDVFGLPQRGQKNYVVSDAAIELEVLPLPAEGRPEPFYGGVGRFDIDARFDRREVDAGTSVKLIFTVSGTGNMEHLQVPELTDIPGFHRLGKIENRTRDRVVVTYDLAPKTAEVTGVAPIEWNYFDTTPGVESYVTKKTEPLSIRVRARAGETSLPDLPGEKPDAVEAGVDDIFDVRLGADQAAPRFAPAPAPATVLLASTLPWLVCAFGLFLWRARVRSLADVRGRRARGAWRRLQGGLQRGGDPLDGFVGYLADRLGCEPAAVIGPDLADRLRAAGVADAAARDASAAVEAGVAARYGGSGGVDGAAVLAVAEAIESGSGSGSGSGAGGRAAATGAGGSGAPALLLGAVLVAGAALPAQDVAAAEAAYRRGDYAAAAAGFRTAADQGDRRAAYNLGNSLFRQGLYARALAAYEKARLAMPRDAELLVNIRLARERLDLGSAEGEAFSQTVAAIRGSFTPRERFWACVFGNALAAVLVCFGGRRLRILGLVVAVPAVLLVLEVAVFLPARPPRGIVIAPKAAVRAEPTTGVEPLMQVRGGVAVEVLGGGRDGEGWTHVRVAGRKGWVPAESVIVID